MQRADYRACNSHCNGQTNPTSAHPSIPREANGHTEKIAVIIQIKECDWGTGRLFRPKLSGNGFGEELQVLRSVSKRPCSLRHNRCHKGQKIKIRKIRPIVL